ncbi:TonB-dependent receptor [Pseudotamlana agarivorans]|uniref:TonB-dependent receptor n=1 Tax=Pseudotamlana agarivorans TaxID=481183 RepID=UPI00082AD3A3|nr:TonB-dependent receptor [Tamlana agarivorans]
MFYKILSAWLGFSLCTLAFAQNSSHIKGFVVDEKTLQPIEGVNIIVENGYAISTEKGEFNIKNLLNKSYQLKISFVGYETQTITISPPFKMLDIHLKESTTILEEVEIVGHSKHRREKESSVSSVSVDKTFLHENRENSLMQTLEKIPGVSTINIGSGQSKPVIRGLGFNRVAVVQNGIKHEAQQWGADHGLEIDQYGIENVQIIKGPISLLYGSDAIAGVVNIKAPPVPLNHTFSGSVNLLGESNNDLIGVSSGIAYRKDKWFYRGRLTYRDYGDYKVPTDKVVYDNYVFDLHKNYLRNTAGKEANASASIGYVDGDFQSETFISNVNGKNGFFANAHGLEVRVSDIDYDKSNRDIDLPYHSVNHFKITNTTCFLIEDHHINIDLGFQNNYREERSEPVPHGYMPKPADSKERSFNKNTYSLNVTDMFYPFNHHEFIAGLNVEYQDNNIGGSGFLIPEYNRFAVGAFIFDKYEINKKLFLQAGLRFDYGVYNTFDYYDWYPSKVDDGNGGTTDEYLQRSKAANLHFGNVSGSVGLSYIADKTTYKFNIGKSFRMPLANELASDGVNYHMYRYEKGNIDLDPEESYQIDLDINHTTDHGYVTFSPFVNFFDNFIYLNPTPDYYETQQVYEYTQSKVFRFGGEISAGTTLFHKLELDVSTQYVYSRQTSGPKKDFTIPFSPPLSGLVSVGYQFQDASIFQAPKVVVSYIITADQNEIVPPEKTTEGYQVFNLSFLLQIATISSEKPLEIRFKLNNIFNTKYYNHTSFYRLIDVPEAGRNVSISLTQNF